MPEIPASEWEKDESGGLIVRALVGWGTIGATDGNSGALRLEYVGGAGRASPVIKESHRRAKLRLPTNLFAVTLPRPSLGGAIHQVWNTSLRISL